jgi:hypothetical protein
MAVTVVASGAQAATIDTVHSLSTGSGATGGGHYWLTVQAPSGTTAADAVVLRAKRECRTADSVETVYEATFRGGGAVLGFVTPVLPVPEGFSYEFSLEQTDGTGRTWSWSVERA